MKTQKIQVTQILVTEKISYEFPKILSQDSSLKFFFLE